MKIAVIDLGTNTFNLLVRDTEDHEEIHAMKLPVKLGQDGILKHRITEDAMQRGMDALARYRSIIDSLDVEAVCAFGTSALRDAENRQVFIDQVKTKYGFNINVISGDGEAELIFEGVKYGLDLRPGRNLIMDIGGGSTEFVLTENNQLVWSRSFQIGSSRLNDQFPVSDPILDSEIAEICRFIKHELNELWEVMDQFPVDCLIGSSGSFETLAQVALARRGQPHESPGNGFEIRTEEFNQVAEYILRSSLAQRLENPAILNMRADMIVIAMVMLKLCVDQLNIKQIKLSNFALKEGVFSKLMENKLIWQKS